MYTVNSKMVLQAMLTNKLLSFGSDSYLTWNQFILSQNVHTYR